MFSLNLTLRRILILFANVRPCVSFQLKTHTTSEHVFFPENTEGNIQELNMSIIFHFITSL